MAENLAPYACDRCRMRKISCCRTRSGCQRCKEECESCIYSRSGVIRRKRKTKQEASVGIRSSNPSSPRRHISPAVIETQGHSLQSQVAIDVEVTRERLRGLHPSDSTSLGALSSLSDAYAAVWHETSEFSMTNKSFFLFEDHASDWVDVFINTLKRGGPLLSAPPSEVLDNLRSSQPQEVRERSWLVMYYSIILSMVSSTAPEDESTKTKLRCNLWLALNDVRLLLEPRESNIQALVLLASHVEEFTTPLLSWMLVGNACRMLQALGINYRSFDSETRERRRMMFWYLNILDQGLAVVFGKPPNFHRAIVREVALPTLEQLLPFQPHRPSTNTPGLFGAHFVHQIFLNSRMMADIWSCLYDESAADSKAIDLAIESLDSWFRPAKKLLEAAALAEKPFLDKDSAASVDLGLQSINFSYEYLLVLLTRSSVQRKTQCIEASKRMLHLLPYLVSDSEEVFNGIVWQLICCPFTPFLVLFREILSNGRSQSREIETYLAAIERLPVFLEEMGLRNSLAAKLKRIATVLAHHARSIVHPQDSRAIDVGPLSSDPEMPLGDLWALTGDTLDWNSLFNQATVAFDPGQVQTSLQNIQQTDTMKWTNDFFGDTIFDWMLYDNGI